MRRRMLAACIALACVQLIIHSSPASGIARFFIRGDGGRLLCEYYPGPGELFEVFVFVNTDEEGVYCAEYKMLAPDNWTHIGTVGSAEISTEEGNPAGAPGVKVCFTECQTVAFWMYKLIYTHVDGQCSIPETVAHDETGGHLVRICLEPDYPKSDAYADWNVGPNCLCPAVEETSWGAIKGIYK